MQLLMAKDAVVALSNTSTLDIDASHNKAAPTDCMSLLILRDIGDEERDRPS
jgi:hypothetical protein